MRAGSRLSLVLALTAASLMLLSPLASAAPVDCTYTNSKKLVTITIDNTDSTGWLAIEREVGTTKIGYTSEGDSWKGCEGARTNSTDKVKVVGSTLSDEIYLDLGNGAFAPGASNESSGASEIEFELDLGAGTDAVHLVGGRGADRLAFVKPGQAQLNGDDDIDVTMSGVDRWELLGDAGHDTLDARGAPLVRIWGGADDDRLLGGPGNDDLYADDGNDADGDDTLIGGGGDDAMYGYLGDDELNGGDGDDYLFGAEGKDVLQGGSGDDDFGASSGKDGADSFDGGSGYDGVSYSSRSGNVKLSLDGKANDGAKNEGDNVAANIEQLGGGAGNDVLVGSDASNNLYGEFGNDVLKGLGGSDYLNDGEGNDEVFGGPGSEYMTNRAGEDEYYGGDGDDYIDAGSNADGRDVFSGGPGEDRLDYSERSLALFIDVADPGGDGDVASSENDNVKPDFERVDGGSDSDEIRGGGSGEYLYGGGSFGNDTLIGRGGPDVLNSGEGADNLNGGEGYDSIYAGGGDDTVDSLDDGEDYVDCGAGVTDTVTAADGFDEFANCEVLPL